MLSQPGIYRVWSQEGYWLMLNNGGSGKIWVKKNFGLLRALALICKDATTHIYIWEWLHLYTVGWGQILECINFTHFPINWMLRSFKCIEISLSDQTPGAETLSKVCVWTNESSAGSVQEFVQSSTKVVQLSFFCCLLPITNCLLPIAYCQLLIADYQWPND